MLFRSIAVQERPAQVDDGLSFPDHAQARFFCDFSHNSRFQILPMRRIHERRNIFGRKHNRHALLAFRDRQFSSVQPFVFFGHGIQLNQKAVRQFANRDAYAAGSKVIAPFDEPRDAFISEQTLKLAFRRRVALLYFCAAGFDR